MTTDPALRRLALGTLLAAFPGHTATDRAIALLDDGLAGHTLFARNIAGPAQAARLTATLRAARPDVLIAVDEEGGDVTRLAHRTGSTYPGNAALGAVDDPELTRAVYAAIGTDLATAGVNLDLAPVVDVNTADDNPVIGTRSFGADPARVARHAAAAVAGLQDTGVAACAKHFPGHGATVTDSHLELPTVDAPREVLRARDLLPFAAAVEAGAQAVMTAHIRVPALTGDAPATFSRRVLDDLLRGEYGFRGTVITDALEMRAAAVAAGGTPRAAVRALAAGADLICIGAAVTGELVEAVAAEIVTAVRDGRLPLDRLTDAAARTATLAAWAAPGSRASTPPATVIVASHAGAAPRTPAAATDPSPAATPSPEWSRPGAALGLAAARRAVRVEGSPADLAGPMVVRLVAGHSVAEGRVPWGLGPHLDGIEQLDVVPAEARADELAARAGDRPVVIVGRRVHQSPTCRSLVERLAATHAVGVVEMGWPSRWRPAHVRAFVTTHGASLANGRAAAEALGLVR